MEIAEKVCMRGMRGGGLGDKGSSSGKDLSKASGEKKEKQEKEDQEAFEIMANVVWAEFGKAIMDEMGGVVFAAGRPDEFRKVLIGYFPFRTPANDVI